MGVGGLNWMVVVHRQMHGLPIPGWVSGMGINGLGSSGKTSFEYFAPICTTNIDGAQ